MGRLPSSDVRVSSREETEHGTAPPAALAADLRAGTRLAAYRLEAVIGRGGMGVVYRAEHVHLRRTAAVKLLLPELAHDESFRERFLRESQIAAAMQHPSIVSVYDAGEADGLLYIAMQYVDGTDLAAVLRHEAPLQPERALAILGQVADALDAAHALGIVHRDVKPGNVLIDARRCYLTDFGLTRRIESQTALTARSQFVGTIDYMPPEQIEGRALDPRTDVYALGCMLYHTLVGRVPYEKDSEVSVMYAHVHEQPPAPSEKKAGLPGELDAVIGRAMAKRKEDRHESCAELIAAARAALGYGSPTAAAVIPVLTTPRRTVVVADDEASIRALVRVSLDEGRFRVLDAADGEAAIALARHERPDLLLVDWSLPSRSDRLGGTEPQGGREVCEAVRAEAQAAPKIVVLAAPGDALDEGAARAAGADGAIRKPFSSLQLLFKVEELLGAEALH
jgi:serine/threonine protein kinase